MKQLDDLPLPSVADWEQALANLNNNRVLTYRQPDGRFTYRRSDDGASIVAVSQFNGGSFIYNPCY